MQTIPPAFNAAIPLTHQDKMRRLAELGAEWIDTLPGDSFGDDPKIDPVEWQSRDGFISSNLGGYSVTQSYFCGYGSGIYHSAKEREFTELVSNEARADYLRDNNMPELPDNDAARESFYEYESEYMNDMYTILEIEVFIPDRAPDSVQISVLLHYRDAPYHRSNRAEQVYCATLPLANMDPVAVMGDIRTAYGAA